MIGDQDMWSRVVEIMFGWWLLISPFVFGHESGETTLWVNDLACGSAVIAFGLSSYWRPTRHAHLLTIGVSLWLIVFAYWHGFTSPLVDVVMGTAPAPSEVETSLTCATLGVDEEG